MLRAAALTAAVVLAIAQGAAGEIPLSERRSTYEDMSPETKAMQDGDTDNQQRCPDVDKIDEPIRAGGVGRHH